MHPNRNPNIRRLDELEAKCKSLEQRLARLENFIQAEDEGLRSLIPDGQKSEPVPNPAFSKPEDAEPRKFVMSTDPDYDPGAVFDNVTEADPAEVAGAMERELSEDE